MSGFGFCCAIVASSREDLAACERRGKMAPLQAVSVAPKNDPRVLDVQARIEFLKSTCRLVGHFRFVPDDHPDKDFHRFCQGLGDQFEGLARRMVAPGATEDPENSDISGEIQCIKAVLETMLLFYPEMEGGRFLEPLSGIFSEFFTYLFGLVDEAEKAWESIIVTTTRNE